MRRAFFNEDAYDPLKNEEGDAPLRHWLTLMSVKLLDPEQANKIDHHKLFDLLLSRGERWDRILSLPLLPEVNGINHVAVPFSIDEHEDKDVHGHLLSNVIQDFFDKALSRKKYVFSCDPRHFVAAELETFSYDIAHKLARDGGGNNGYILFDSNAAVWMTYNPDLPFVIISRRESDSANLKIGGWEDEFWRNYFSENIDEASSYCGSCFAELFNKTFLPRLRGFSEISL
jgi:hypothetical protein